MAGMETIGQRIKKFREYQGMSQQRLARMLQVSREAVSQWESDDTEPRPKRVRQIATALGVPYPILLLGDEAEVASGVRPFSRKPR